MSEFDLFLDEQMAVCLDIMSQGEDMLATGQWEAPIKRMGMMGLCEKQDSGAWRITSKGEAEHARREDADIRGMIGEHNQRVAAGLAKQPDWSAQVTPGVGLIVTHRNAMAVSGLEALRPAAGSPVTHGATIGPDQVFLRNDVDGFLQAMLDLAWARGLRPTEGPKEMA